MGFERVLDSFRVKVGAQRHPQCIIILIVPSRHVSLKPLIVLCLSEYGSSCEQVNQSRFVLAFQVEFIASLVCILHHITETRNGLI